MTTRQRLAAYFAALARRATVTDTDLRYGLGAQTMGEGEA